MKKDELKPCPLCNEMPTRHENQSSHGVCCTNTDCSMWCEWIPDYKWNSRPIEDELRAEIERLKAKLNTTTRIRPQEYPKHSDSHAWIAENDPGIVVRFGDKEIHDPNDVRCSE